MSAVTIRKAKTSDTEAILDMGAKFYAGTMYPSIADYCRNSVTTVVNMMLDTGVLLVAEGIDGALSGMVGLVVVPFFPNHAHLIASEVMWWVEPEALRSGTGQSLLVAAEAECRAKGVSAINLILLENSPPHAREAYEAMGCIASEHMYSKVVS